MTPRTSIAPLSYERGATMPGSYAPPREAVRLRPLPWSSFARAASVVSLVVADVAAFVLSAVVVIALRDLAAATSAQIWALSGSALVWLALRSHDRLYKGYGLAPAEELQRSVRTTVVSAVSHVAALLAMHDLNASRFVALGTWLLLLPMAWSLRGAVKALLLKLRLYGRPTLIVGAGKVGRLVARELQANQSFGLVPVAFLDTDEQRLGESYGGVPVVGHPHEVDSIEFPYTVRNCVVALTDASGRESVAIASSLARRFPEVSVVPDLLGLANMWVQPRAMGTVLTLAVRSYRFERSNLVLKRVFDLCVGVPLFLLSLPVLAIAAASVKLMSPGRAFFAQKREGLGGSRIRVWKVRTMVPDAERMLERHLSGDEKARAEWETSMKLRRDPRVIPLVGAFLRRSSIDELPQLWNVIKGEMSLVGPRPFPDYHVRRFGSEFRALRCQVPPGITGFWQVTVRSESDVAMQEASDSYYIQNWSLWLDLWILVRTFRVVVAGKGAY